MGVCKQLKDEIYRCPPVLVLIGRPADAWLATWSRADLVVPHPLDPVAVAEAVAELARRRLSADGSGAVTTVPPAARRRLAAPDRHPARGSDLTARQTAWAMEQVMNGDATDVQLAGFLVALRAKGETVEELGRPRRRRCCGTPSGSRCRACASTSSARAATGGTP